MLRLPLYKEGMTLTNEWPRGGMEQWAGPISSPPWEVSSLLSTNIL
jgi:hypothetical protein